MQDINNPVSSIKGGLAVVIDEALDRFGTTDFFLDGDELSA